MASRLAACGMVLLTSLAANGWGQDVPADTAPAVYHIEFIQPPPGFHSIRLQAINNAGDAAGIVDRHFDPSASLVIRRADGGMRVMPLPDICTTHDLVRVLRFNDQGQMLLDTSNCHSTVRSMLWGPRSGWKNIPQHALGMNDLGDVVGVTDDHLGFVWKWDGDYTAFPLDGGVEFDAINDRREIAGTVTHVADPREDYDRDGVTGALLHFGHDPVYTGDKVIQSLADYKNPEYRQHRVASRAGAINERGALGLTIGTRAAGRPVCLWHRDEALRCADKVRHATHVVGVDGQDRLVFAAAADSGASYVFLPDGGTWSLNSVVDQDSFGPLAAQDVSESGLVVGTIFHRDPRSFILTPIDRR